MEMNIMEIMKLIPHRYPFLLVDKIVEFVPKERIVGIKNVTINEPFFQGHFPGHPIMPGALLLEAMAQVGCVLMFKSFDLTPEEYVVYFMGIDKARFRKPVRPGDTVKFVLEPKVIKKKLSKLDGKAYVDEELVCEAELMAMIVRK
ncbi:3-hydroxyacyl-ACP dehydratase FabZ [Phorcysia thermohydrogeniphila]|uniref:3-hydroxyacyl-[acyl-carrier-protein] dehydratase FabZ n=1 Tax=Phorcysia thermohydrogeniphila TaxID=936138 RepID=A0A4R1GEN3_9BACT|nr:3-hydroxyacyl-ACP dehydratase FabZ [Phorcysia thermohydrogeniphila]TCK06438.1 3-hydroxyacyl-[acyl-carrier-protein] dehydratase [Phorcysia thermohydrogeniphila]